MRVLLSTFESRGDVEPVSGLAVRWREPGAEIVLCAPPDFADRPAPVGVPPARPVRTRVTGDEPPSQDRIGEIGRRALFDPAAAVGRRGGAHNRRAATRHAPRSPRDLGSEPKP
ncbi:hypothetical protein B4N89_38820 [Embleya scabrispora]|uniref:Uncharacterized protein n=1 Tax=Embleya scabrispora TaxID=159449 RepID=A0A1T3NMV7_9ACTN|nr:hypothetical protein B4N89_38820 [Embleya scabrispora]